MVKRKYFGTDGIRGVVPTELSPAFAFRVGQAAQAVLGKESACVIGCDTRISSDAVRAALASGMATAGGNVIDVGVMPTPGISYLIRHYRFGYGGVVSASHNPFEYNGIKFFNEDGIKLSDEKELEIEALIDSSNPLCALPDKIGRIEIMEDAEQVYSEFLASFIFKTPNLKIGFDCANGATSASCLLMAEKAGLNASFVNTEPDGLNINKNCGATHPELLQKFVIDNNLSGGFAFDGDGDRVVAVDEKGRLLSGDHIIGFLAIYLHEKGLLHNPVVVGTVMSNFALEKFLRDKGLELLRAPVGDRYVLEKMLENGSVVGGEESGHIILLDRTKTGDGLLVAATIINILAENSLKFSDMHLFDPVPSVLINVKVKDKRKFEEDEELRKVIEDESRVLEGAGRIVVRPSGTEPLIRVMVEAEVKEVAENTAKKIAKIIEERLG